MQLSESEILSVMKNLDIRKAVGPDNIPPVLLEECCYELCASLCSLYNRSLSEGYVPTEWLKANVTPIFKSGDRHLLNNYRQMSLLSIVSKVMERCAYNQLFCHM